jgi:hypothetical protein
VDHLKARNYEGLALQTRVLESTGHSGTKAEGYARGLQFVFTRPSLKIAPDILEQYTGAYQLNPETKIILSKEKDHLIAQASGNSKLVLYAETEKDFYVKGLYFFVHFKKDDTGKIIGFQLEQFSGVVFLKKVD